jgi:hypothetical protein
MATQVGERDIACIEHGAGRGSGKQLPIVVGVLAEVPRVPNPNDRRSSRSRETELRRSAVGRETARTEIVGCCDPVVDA